MPEAAFRSGDFSSAPTKIYDPATGTWTATGPRVYGLHGGAALALLRNGQVLSVGGSTLAKVDGASSRVQALSVQISATDTNTATPATTHPTRKCPPTCSSFGPAPAGGSALENAPEDGVYPRGTTLP